MLLWAKRHEEVKQLSSTFNLYASAASWAKHEKFAFDVLSPLKFSVCLTMLILHWFNMSSLQPSFLHGNPGGLVDQCPFGLGHHPCGVRWSVVN